MIHHFCQRTGCQHCGLFQLLWIDAMRLSGLLDLVVLSLPAMVGGVRAVIRMRMVTHLLLAWGGLLAYAPCNTAMAAEDSCASPETTKQINKCMSDRLARAESELSSTYQKVLAQFDESDAMGRPQDQEKESLEKAQRYWIKFREANCFTVWSMNADGTIRTSLNIGCLEELAIQREQHLRKWFLAAAESSAK